MDTESASCYCVFYRFIPAMSKKRHKFNGIRMIHFKDADIVVIGAGAAGAMAAIDAHRTHPKLRIVALDKSKMETSVAGGVEWMP